MPSFIWDTKEITCTNPEDIGTYDTVQNQEDGVVSIVIRYCSSNPDSLPYLEQKSLELYIAQYGI